MNELNWSQEVIMALISLLPLVVSSVLMIKIYLKYKNRFLLYLSIAWVSLVLFWFFTAISYLLMNIKLYIYTEYLTIVIYLLIVVAFDLMYNDRIRVVRFGIFCASLGIQAYLLFMGNIAEEFVLFTGEPSFRTIGFYRNSLAINALYGGLVYFIATVDIYRLAPVKNKTMAILNFTGAFLVSIGPVIIFVLRITDYILGIDILIAGIGLLLSSIALYKTPQLLFILPFQAYRLTIIQSKTGLTIHDHIWGDHMHINEKLYASIIEGIRGVTSEIFNFGTLREMKLEQGMLILEYSPKRNFYFLLLSIKSSSILRTTLRHFAQEFSDNFGDQLVGNFVETTDEIENNLQKLVDTTFSFIPSS